VAQLAEAYGQEGGEILTLLITGLQRSGTTLLRRLCDGHPDISVTNEFGSFFNLGQPYRVYSWQLLRRWGQVQDKWAYDSAYVRQGGRRWRNLAFTLRYLRYLAAYRTQPVTAVSAMSAMQQLFPRSRLVGDKLPQYMPLLDTFVRQPNLACIVIYRDCRDVTSSFLVKVRTTWRTRAWVAEVDTAAKIARRWLDYIELMERHADQIHTIRYESLVQQPQPVLDNLAAWLAVDPAGFATKEVRDSSIGNYQKNLTQSELADVLAVAGPTMARLGY
jgi:hypothetical protein